MTDLTKLSRRSFMIMPLAFAACKPGATLFELTGLTMGTTYTVMAVDPTRALRRSDVQAAVDGALADVNRRMSNWDASSEISRFNAGTGPVTMSGPLAEVMQAAEAVHMASDGRFDTTLGPLIELWGFGATGMNTMPSEPALGAARAASGHKNTLMVSGRSLEKRRPDAQVYLAAIGKGYGADAVGRALTAMGMTDFMVEIGGDLYASGRNPDGLPWQIGIETPAAFDRSVFDVVGVSGLGLASSGDYRNYFERDGQRYSHIIDPQTGRPITHHTASATVLAENAMLADAWATAMLILGRERGLQIAEAQDLAVLFIERDPEAHALQFQTATSSRFTALTA